MIPKSSSQVSEDLLCREVGLREFGVVGHQDARMQFLIVCHSTTGGDGVETLH